MKNSSKILVTGLTAAALIGAGIKVYNTSISKDEVYQALATGNEIKNEQIVEIAPSEASAIVEYRTFFGSNVKDIFEEATESEDETDATQETEEENTGTPEINPADKIADEITTEVDSTSNEILGTPNVGEKTELVYRLFRGSPDEIWKISGLIALSTLLGAGLITAGTNAGVKKSRKKKAMINDAKYFIGSENVNKLNALTSVSKQIDKYEEKITDYTNRAKNAGLKNKNKLLEKARDLKLDNNYIELKKFKNQLVSQINSLVEKNITINPKKLNFLKNYAKFSKKIIAFPESQNKILAKSLSKNVHKYNSLNKKIQKSELSKSYVAKTKRIESKITKSLKKASSLTGFNKVLFNEISNNQDGLFGKSNLVKIQNLSTYLKSSKSNYNNYKSLLYKTLEADYYSSKNKVKKSERIKDRILKISNKLKNNDPRADLKYYGYINKIKNIPINPLRYISSNGQNDDIREFFDDITSSYLNKDKFSYETTVNYQVLNKNYSFVCFFDNKEAIKLVKAKFVASLPENAKNVKIIEKTMNYNDEKFKTIETDFNLSKNPCLYEETLDQSKKLVYDFESLIKNKNTIINNVNSERNPRIKKDPTNKNENIYSSDDNKNRVLNLWGEMSL